MCREIRRIGFFEVDPMEISESDRVMKVIMEHVHEHYSKMKSKSEMTEEKKKDEGKSRKAKPMSNAVVMVVRTKILKLPNRHRHWIGIVGIIPAQKTVAAIHVVSFLDFMSYFIDCRHHGKIIKWFVNFAQATSLSESFTFEKKYFRNADGETRSSL